MALKITFGAYGNLLHAFSLIAADNGMRTVKAINSVAVPSDWRDKLSRAEAAAERIGRDSKISDFINPDEVDTDLASPEDNAFEIICAGEESVSLAVLATVKDGDILHEVLESAFDGELCDYIFTQPKF